ncbi:MAG TPA: AarF/ABC1/UbiB kinase family protein [Acidimicrobiales bacterium]|nr:AarF/ABC1/UbiB kinase family protein [Acidimicrobiales bacterium]
MGEPAWSGAGAGERAVDKGRAVARSHGLTVEAIRGFGTHEVRRAAATAAVLGRHGVRFAWRSRPGARDGTGYGEIGAAELREAFAELGPTYVKLAQLIASSPGLFPEVLSDELRSLLDEVPPIPADEVRAILTEELGAPPDQVFASLDPTPLASASIAQVHAATLPDGEEVVVKVQRPGIREQVERDLRILMRMAQVLERASTRGRMANPVAVVEDFAATLAEELNFVNEGRAMEMFEANLRRFGDNGTVRVPTVRWPYTTPRVLTMERIHGFKIDDLAQLDAQGWDLAAALKRGVRAWMEAALEHGYFHGDVHAGNLMLDTAGNVVFLDFGIMGHLDPKTMDIIRHGLPALLVEGDFVEVAKAIYDLGAVLNPVEFEESARDIAEIVEPILGKPLSEISYGQVLVDIVRIGTKYEVRLPREMVLVAKQMLYFERYAKLMAPDWNILDDPELIGFLFEGLDTHAEGDAEAAAFAARLEGDGPPG